MEPTAPPRREPKPRGLMFVVVLMFFQAFFNFGGGLLLQSELSDALGHGQEVVNEGFVRFIIGLSFVLCVVQLICGLLIPRRIPWTRSMAIVVELVTIGCAIIGAVNNASVLLIFSAVLPVLALRFLFTREVAEWFGQ